MFQLAVGGVGAVFSSFKQSCLTYVDANIFFSIFFFSILHNVLDT